MVGSDPILLFFDPDLPRRFPQPTAVPMSWRLYALVQLVRPIAVGMMLVAAVNTLFSMRSSLAQSLRGAFMVRSSAAGDRIERTDRDMPMKWVLLAMVCWPSRRRLCMSTLRVMCWRPLSPRWP